MGIGPEAPGGRIFERNLVFLCFLVSYAASGSGFLPSTQLVDWLIGRGHALPGLRLAGWGGGEEKKTNMEKNRPPEGDLILFQPRGAERPSVDLYSEGGVPP